jgi:CO/xanthine dehydrogenase FAD-binding subunit
MYTNNYVLSRDQENMAGYLRPSALDDALTALDAAAYVIVAGGTDYYPARVGRPLDDDVLDVTDLAGLRDITETPDYWRFGALVTWTDIIRADLPPLFDGLKLAAREVGGPQVQNAGTLAGNICNASPAADGMPNLLALDAEIELSCVSGERKLPIGAFVTGNRKTERRANELVTGILIPKPPGATNTVFLKLGARKYMVISIVMVGATLETAPDGTVTKARIAVGSCSEVARRLSALETALVGKPASAELGNMISAEHLSALAPIADIRGSAGYRMDAALTLVRRALNDLGRSAWGGKA